jgi:hypothetical protein
MQKKVSGKRRLGQAVRQRAAPLAVAFYIPAPDSETSGGVRKPWDAGVRVASLRANRAGEPCGSSGWRR